MSLSGGRKHPLLSLAGVRLFYLFDYGDDWMHEVDVIKIEQSEKRKGSPRIVKKIGRAPPQYREDC